MHRNKYIAAIIAFFAGSVGLHQLYLGKLGAFIWFMILFVASLSINFPITTIIAFFQGLKFLMMSEKVFDYKYNSIHPTPVRTGPVYERRKEQMKKNEQFPQIHYKYQDTKDRISPQARIKANEFKNSGIKKYKDFDLEDAIDDFKKGLEILPNDVALHFNIACAYSLTEKKELAYDHLNKAVAYGLKDVERILTHDDLAYVRIQPEFDAFRASGFKVNPFTHLQQTQETDTSKVSEPQQEIPIADESLLAQLKKLSDLRNKGILSEEEFIHERKKILNQ
ncbi:MAG: NINE protein [Saprospiraceae bacterium]|nr:NINE protein [Saprospiraceae bacterium]